ncbi:ATP synthase subunit delta [bacterium BMS3Abin07]|nr:ATP synthase subunit delta [bacterium BMS3Abin07]GBE32009.1 ATP synthase subunit delta [bacterium BMS3Bbin05]HDL20185.1 ATP synthase F1 subunit delta [Nitrospirota bacterium]HDO21413.1 ATP synthase F1 subunit delta [Nitrospirota bacterium]HDZ87175.1 ATP synthase F1 subunit delta [Nitrospirota bacterium]
MADTFKIARKYAKTLFNAVEIDKFEEAFGQLSLVNEVMQKSRDIFSSLTSPLFSLNEKERTVGIISGAINLSGNIEKYLKYLAANGAIAILPEILKLAVDMYREKKKKTKAIVISAVEISEDIGRRLKDILGRLTSKDVEIEYDNDPSLLGGFIIKMGSTMYDSSLKGQLKLLEDELIKG